MYQIWRAGVTLETWFLLQDEPPTTIFQSGLYFGSPSLITAKPKPLLTTFRFPFVAYLRANGRVFIWGRDRASTQQNITIQRRIGTGAWKTVATITSNSYGVFTSTLKLGATAAWYLRAVDASGSSPQFSLTVPPNENMYVTPFTSG
jgi:hypothetical protein